jgi:Protein of unknown function (DUF4232)
MSVLPYVRRSGAALAALAVLVGVSSCGQDAGPVAAPSATGASPAPATPTPATPTPATPTPAVPVPTTAAPATTRPPVTGPSTGAPPAAGPGRCHTSELSLAFGPADAGAGQRQGRVLLQNESSRRCTIFGFGGLQVLDAARRPLPVTLSRVGPRPTLVRFGPRSNVIGKSIRWGAIPAGVTCVRPVYVLVTPPDETDPLTARWPYGPVCGGRIAGFAYGTDR